MSKHILTVVVICTEQSRQSIQDTLNSIQCECMVEAILVNANEKEFEMLGNLQISYLDYDTLGEALEAAKTLASGKYIHIIEAGDMYYEKSLCKLVELMESNAVDIMNCSLFESRSLYKIETTYSTNKRSNYTPKKVNNLPIRLKGCIFKTEMLETYQFARKLDHSFELACLAEILNHDQLNCIKAMDCVVVYAKKNELIPCEDSDYTSDFVEEMHRREGFSAVQEYYLINELKKYLTTTNIKYRANNWKSQEKDLYIEKIRDLLKKISDDSIANISSVIIAYKNYFFKLKYGSEYVKELTIERKEKKYYISFENKQLFNIAASGNFKINILESRKNILTIDGLEVFQMLGGRFELIAVDTRNNIYYPEMHKWTLADKAGFVGESAYEGRRFKFEIPLNSVKQIDFKLRDCNTGEEYELTPTFGPFAKLVKSNKASYYAKDNWICRYKNKGISVSANRKKTLLKSEAKFLYSLLRQKKYNMILLRIVYHICTLFKKKPLWLIRDNEDRAKDSGAEMFKYYSATKELKELANAYFILDRHSEDYVKMKKFGKIIQPDSFKYKLYHLLADKLIDTRGGISGKYIFKEDIDYVSDLCDWDYIWLIHGIMIRNGSSWTNKYVLNAKLFATCNKRERASILDVENGYGYEESEVVLTGLPRHDSLCANKKKKILFLPTWRKNLAGDLIPGTSERSYVNNFKENDYYCFYNALINHPRLLEVMRKKGYTGDFYLHPSFMKQHVDFEGNELIYVGTKAADSNQLIGECSLLVTDYSSAQFEACYLDTPVVYAQYDSETFSDNHTGKEGYFVCEEDGFGPVCYNLEETVDAIVSYIEDDCTNREPYKTRAKEFFAHRDRNNSKRVFDQISKMEGVKDKRIKVEHDSEYAYLYKGSQLISSISLEAKGSIYNHLFDIKTYVKKVSMKASSFVIDAKMIINEKDFMLPHHNFDLCIGDHIQKITFADKKLRKQKTLYRFVCEIAYEEILLLKKSTPMYIIWEDEDGWGYRGEIKYYVNKKRGKETKKLHFSEVRILEDIDTSVFIRETMKNNVCLCVREIERTDYPAEQRKLKRAYFWSRMLWWHPIKKSKLFFEKFSSKYEESASVLFEHVIEQGERNSFFIIDRESLHYSRIPEKYKKYVIDKYSFKHYLYFFMAQTFISTESMNHIIGLNICDANVSLKIGKGEYDYIFLQHGVMYMYCLEHRTDFVRGKGFTKNSKVVVSSQTEADHFITYGHFNQRDLIISGLPKFDRNYKLPNADKILIMPTSRAFEYNIIRLNPMESTYYKFVKNIIACVPEELREKVIVVGHPLLKEHLLATDLKEFIPQEYVYNELLQETRLLITDYSSISYDAFYRGSNVILCWEDKDMCLGVMDYKLMLNEENAFADISHSFSDLSELIERNYYGEQSEENIAKYREIVAYSDNKNTERCYQELVKFRFYGKQKRISIRKCRKANFGRKTYTGDRVTHNNMEVYYDDRLLVRNRDYKVFYFNNKRSTANAIAIMIGRGMYYGLLIKRFCICDSIRTCEIEGVCSENGIITYKNIAVKNRKGRYLKRNKDYKVVADESQNGISILQIKGKGKYGKSIKLRYRGTIIHDEAYQIEEEIDEIEEREDNEE